jgi:hypothetical protein
VRCILKSLVGEPQQSPGFYSRVAGTFIPHNRVCRKPGLKLQPTVYVRYRVCNTFCYTNQTTLRRYAWLTAIS